MDSTTRSVRGYGRETQLTAPAGLALEHLARRAPNFVPEAELSLALAQVGSASADVVAEIIDELKDALRRDGAECEIIESQPGLGLRLLVMPKPPPRVAFMDQLRQRGVIEVAVTYVIVGWLLLQIADVTFDQLALPPWAGTFVAFLVIAGFPIAVLLAWFVELTDRGAVLDTNPGARPLRGRVGKTYVAIVGAFAIAAVAVFAYDRYVGLPGEPASVIGSEPLSPPAVAVDPSSIAVLPFSNIDGSDDTRIFSDGLAEDLIYRLAGIPGLSVPARGDSFSLSPTSSSQDVRNRLRVAYYLEGSVRLTDDNLRVGVTLIDSQTGMRLMTRIFNRALSGFFDIQDEITSLTVASLRAALPPDTQLDFEATPAAPELDAYVHYRRGMAVLYQPLTPESIEDALEDFRESLAIDEEYAAAFAGMCLTYSSGYGVTLDPAFIDRAEESCNQALLLNPNLYLVHNALGDLYARTGEYDDAADSYQKALLINARDPEALTGLARANWRRGRLEDAEAGYREAITAQPGNWNSRNALGSFLYFNGRYAEAAAQYREVLLLDDRNQLGWENLAAALMLSGEFEESAAAFERAISFEPRTTMYVNLGLLYYYLGDLEKAEAELEAAIALQANYHLAWSNLGDVLTFAGQPDRAREAFLTAERLVEERLDVNDREAEYLIDLAWIKAMLGEIEEAERLLDEAGDISTRDPYVFYYRALVSNKKGERDKTLEYLEMAVEMGYSRAMIAAEPHLAGLRGERRFAAIVEQ